MLYLNRSLGIPVNEVQPKNVESKALDETLTAESNNPDGISIKLVQFSNVLGKLVTNVLLNPVILPFGNSVKFIQLPNERSNVSKPSAPQSKILIKLSLFSDE